nr:KamA family radical SAM protein [Parachlamydia sp. AcF125]
MIFRQNFTQWKTLADFLELDQPLREQILKHPSFPLNLPRRLAEKIKKNTLDDPILKQFLPTLSEQIPLAGFVLDPVEDRQFAKAPKLLHKYHGRALIVCTSACVMNCRFCFRQNFDYEVQEKGFQKELELIAADESLQEIILSGGDPLSLSDRVIGHLLDELSRLKHVKRVRFHTRFPIGIPERIDENFLKLFESRPYVTWFVLHTNHPHELDDQIFYHLHLLQQKGVILLTQSVLLKGINDCSNVLRELFTLLVNRGIIPYYLHQLDRVQGGGHFEVSEETGKKLIQEIAKYLPGYAVPKYVREIAGEPHKTPLF